MLIDERRRSWLEDQRPGVAHPVMQFVEDRLELGAGTILARMAGDPRLGLGLLLDGRETRILALLAAGYRRPISPGVLDHIRRAGREWGRGEACLAQIHLALSGLPRLSDPEEAAYRLFMAEGLLDAGVAPRDILRALDLDPRPLDRFKKDYNDSEPRVPAGSGRASGRWTDGPAGAGTVPIGAIGATVTGASATLADTVGSFLSRDIAAKTLAALSEFAAGVAEAAGGAVAALGLLVIPYPGGSSVSEGDIPGYDGLSYHWDQEAGRLVLWTQIAKVKIPVVDAHVGLDGIYYDQDHNPVARVVDGRLVIESRALPRPNVMPISVWSDGDGDTTPDETMAARPSDLSRGDEEPRLCPAPGPDVPHGASFRAIAYQERITGLPPGLAVWLNGVSFDGCRMRDGDLLEAKGFGYASFISKNGGWYAWFKSGGKIENQLLTQSNAAGNRRVEWHVAEKKVADLIRGIATEDDLTNITVIWDP